MGVARLMWIARAGARKCGITIDEIIRCWDVSRRTAQRDLARLRRIGYVAYAADPTGTIGDAYRIEPPPLGLSSYSEAMLVEAMRAYEETQSIHVAGHVLGLSHEAVRLRLLAAKERGYDVRLRKPGQRGPARGGVRA